MARLVIGDVVAEKYCIERAIAEGGTGTVFAARHLELDQVVAIKVLYEDLAARSVAAERFRREARAAARMQGPHVCRVLDIGAQPDGSPFMVMEYLEGCHLGRELERRGLLPPQEAFVCLLQACDAVAEAHAAGIVHRDIKPGNLFWATLPDGSRHIKVLGFGVSKSLVRSSPGDPALTISSSSTSSPAYLSPEQLDSTQDVDERTDIWGLGVVFYELLSGRTPFQGDSIPALVSAVLNGRLKPLSELQLGTPPELDLVLAKALSKQRSERYGSIAEFVTALLPLAPVSTAVTAHDVRNPIAARTENRAQVVSSKAQTRAAIPVESLGSTRAPKRYGAWALVVLLMAAAGLALLKWSRGDEDHAQLPTAGHAGETTINASRQTPPETDHVVRPAPAPAAAAAPPARQPEVMPSGVAPEITPLAPPPAKKAVVEKPAARPAVVSPPPLSVRPEHPITDFGGRR